MRKRAIDGSANNFTNLFNLVTAVNASAADYVAQVHQQVNVRDWMRVFALQRIVGEPARQLRQILPHQVGREAEPTERGLGVRTRVRDLAARVEPHQPVADPRRRGGLPRVPRRRVRPGSPPGPNESPRARAGGTRAAARTSARGW